MLKKATLSLVIIGIAILLSQQAFAAPPVVKTVPWVATNPLIPHDTWSGKTITLKGTSDVQGAGIQYTWDFGDGSAVATGTVSDKYAIQATHPYTGAAGTVFTARLTVLNTGTGESASKEYYVAIRDKSLPVEVNVAIDEGLWYLHKTQYRWTSGVDYGSWSTGCGGYACYGYYGLDPSNLNAFEANGHLETGDASNPYVETVARGMRRLFTELAETAIPTSITNPLGTFNPDGNGNAKGIYVNQSYPFYQGGMFIDAIIASGTPNAVVTTGPAGVAGKTYMQVVQDMVDYYNRCQYTGPTAYGGWRYNCGDWPDNSPSQWAAIGLIPAEREWGAVVPQLVKDANKNWLRYSAGTDSSGGFGYTDPNYYPWGPYAVTPSGMVQMVMDGIGRGYVDPIDPTLAWNLTETFLCNTILSANTGTGSQIKDYYYGLFSFVKSMLLHQPNPIETLSCSSKTYDWYNAEKSKGDPTDGIARKLVNDQSAGGYWWGHNYTGEQYYFETAQAILMLGRTLFQAGAPVAVASATPNPAIAGQTINLSGAGSFHQDASKNIISWAWDLNSDGTFETPGVTASVSFPSLGTYPVRLKVCDDGNPQKCAETTVSLLVTIPPIAPTADAGGPYNFCLAPAGAAQTKFFLNGTGSVNPDDGQHETGPYPGDFITAYDWSLAGTNFATGATPDVTAYFVGKGAGSYLISLKVTDNTAASFPSSGQPNLTGTDSSQVFVRAATDLSCTGCVSNLAARPKPTKADLTWTWRAGAKKYNVYRSTVSGGPYILLATVTAPGLPNTGVYADFGLTNGVTYYYVVREAALNGDEICQSNQASAKPVAR